MASTLYGEPFALANGFSRLTVPLRSARTRLLTQAARRNHKAIDPSTSIIDGIWRAVRVSERVLAMTVRLRSARTRLLTQAARRSRDAIDRCLLLHSAEQSLANHVQACAFFNLCAVQLRDVEHVDDLVEMRADLGKVQHELHIE